MFRVVNILGGLFLAANAVYIAYRMVLAGSTLMLVGIAPALIAGVAFGAILVLRGVKKHPAEEESEEDSAEQ